MNNAASGYNRPMMEQRGSGAIVSISSPGIVDTEALRHFSITQERDVIAESRAATPAGRLVTPDDVAGVVAFLCSPEASMIRGQTLVLDGGQTLTFGG